MFSLPVGFRRALSALIEECPAPVAVRLILLLPVTCTVDSEISLHARLFAEMEIHTPHRSAIFIERFLGTLKEHVAVSTAYASPTHPQFSIRIALGVVLQCSKCIAHGGDIRILVQH